MHHYVRINYQDTCLELLYKELYMKPVFLLFLSFAFTPAFTQNFPGWQSFALSPLANSMEHFDVDETGKIWMVGKTGANGLSTFDGKNFSTIPINDSNLKNLRFRSIAVDKSGNKWIPSFDKILQVDNKNAIFVYSLPEESRGLGILDIKSTNNITWAFEHDHLAFYRIANMMMTRHTVKEITEKMISLVGKAYFRPNMQIEDDYKVILNKDGNLFLRFEEGRESFFCIFDGKNISILKSISENKMDEIANNTLQISKKEGRLDTILVGNELAPIYYFDHFSENTAIDNLGCIWTSAEGTRPSVIKLCANNTIFFSSPFKNFPSFRVFNKIDFHQASNFLFDAKNGPLVLSNGKLLHLVENKWFVYDNTNSPLPEYTSDIKKMRSDPSGNLWVLTAGYLLKYTTTQQPNYYLSTSPEIIYSIPKTGGKYVMTITSDIAWKLYSKGDAKITSTKLEGKGNDKVVVTVEAKYPWFPVRYAAVIVIGQGQYAETILQMTNNEPAFILTSNLPTPVPDVGGMYHVAVSSQTAWESVSSDNWILLDTKGGTGNKSIEVKVADNPTSTERTGKVTVSAKGETKDILVTQSGKQYKATFTATTIPATVPDPGGTYRVDVAANTPWEIASSASWVTLDTKSGSSNKSVEVKIADNPLSSTRTGKITLTAKSGETREMSIAQSGKQFLATFTATTIPASVPDVGGTYTLTVSANISWEITSSESWLVLNAKSGTGNKSIEVKVAENPTFTERSSRITLTTQYTTRSIVVKQAGKVAKVEFFGNLPDPLPGEGGKYEILVDANTDWKLTTVSDWMKFTPMAGPSGKTTATLEVLMNPSMSQSRKGGFGVTPTGGKGEAYVTLQQAKLIVTALEPENSNENFKVFPNPVSDLLTVEINTILSDARWQLYDLSGRAVQSGLMKTPSTTINTTPLPVGTYLLSLSNSGSVVRSVRVVKK